MYLTRMELDISKRNTMKALVSPNLFHGAIEAAFPGERTRKLWRIDELAGHCYLLILSDRQPQMDHLVSQFGKPELEKPAETKEYEKLLERIKDNTRWQFRLTANPTICCKNENGDRGIVHAHITPAHQKKWLMDRSTKNGFSISEDDFDVVRSNWQKFFKGAERKKPVTLLAVTYEGVLRVTDAECFRNTLKCGLGREKAFGMGMLTVVRTGDAVNE